MSISMNQLSDETKQGLLETLQKAQMDAMQGNLTARQMHAVLGGIIFDIGAIGAIESISEKKSHVPIPIVQQLMEATSVASVASTAPVEAASVASTETTQEAKSSPRGFASFSSTVSGRNLPTVHHQNVKKVKKNVKKTNKKTNKSLDLHESDADPKAPVAIHMKIRDPSDPSSFINMNFNNIFNFASAMYSRLDDADTVDISNALTLAFLAAGIQNKKVHLKLRDCKRERDFIPFTYSGFGSHAVPEFICDLVGPAATRASELANGYFDNFRGDMVMSPSNNNNVNFGCLQEGGMEENLEVIFQGTTTSSIFAALQHERFELVEEHEYANQFVQVSSDEAVEVYNAIPEDIRNNDEMRKNNKKIQPCLLRQLAIETAIFNTAFRQEIQDEPDDMHLIYTSGNHPFGTTYTEHEFDGSNLWGRALTNAVRSMRPFFYLLDQLEEAAVEVEAEEAEEASAEEEEAFAEAEEI